jgi:cell division protein FtsL
MKEQKKKLSKQQFPHSLSRNKNLKRNFEKVTALFQLFAIIFILFRIEMFVLVTEQSEIKRLNSEIETLKNELEEEKENTQKLTKVNIPPSSFL